MDREPPHPQPLAADAACPWPRALPACLVFLWSRIVFPGRPASPEPPPRAALLVLLVLPGLLLYPCLSFYLFEPDEGRYAEIPREMLARGDWVVPYLQGQPYLDKPPLLYWLVMGSYALCGAHDWAARLVPALAVHCCILLLYFLGRRSLGARAAFWGALLLALMPGFVGMGRLLLLDGVLALWVTLALLAAFEAARGPALHRGWWVLSAVAGGLGVLTKGPVIAILVLPPLWLHRRLSGEGARIGWWALSAWLGLALAVALPWYVAVCLRAPHFARYFLWEHNVVRFVAPFDHIEPVWYYVLPLLAGLVPGTLLLPGFLGFLASGDPDTAARRTSALGFVVLAGLWCVLFYSLSGSKLPTYILPAFPPLALALGYFVARTPRPRPRLLATVLSLGLMVQFGAHYVVVPWYASYRSPLPHWREVAQACGDADTPVLCYPRTAHAVAFYLGREDMPSFRSKEMHLLCAKLRERPRTVLLLTHRHSLPGLRQALPSDLKVVRVTHFGLAAPCGLPRSAGQTFVRLMGETALGLCDLAVVERRYERIPAPAVAMVAR
jgi:4-amino-4-deoxy-L-arabinose transferase-like glycosyltransferase